MKTVLGVTLGHDTSFAHIVDGKVVAVMEAERYFRQKRYKLHSHTLEAGKHISGYQYVSIEDMELFLGMVAKEWGTKFDALAVQNAGRLEEFNNFKIVLDRSGFDIESIYSYAHQNTPTQEIHWLKHIPFFFAESLPSGKKISSFREFWAWSYGYSRGA